MSDQPMSSTSTTIMFGRFSAAERLRTAQQARAPRNRSFMLPQLAPQPGIEIDAIAFSLTKSIKRAKCSTGGQIILRKKDPCSVRVGLEVVCERGFIFRD